MKKYLKNLLQRTLFPVVYWIGSKRKIESNSVFLADAHNNDCPESLETLFNSIEKSNCVVSTSFVDFKKVSLMESLITSIQTVWKSSNKKVIVLCDNYHALDSFNRREGTTVIQLWHGSGAYKKFGYDSNSQELSLNKKNKLYRYDIVTTSSEFSSSKFSSAMRLPKSSFYNIGLSRTDKFFDSKWCQSISKSFYNKYPEFIEKKIILWAPTFRNLSADNQLLHIGEKEIDKLSKELGSEFVIIKKLHPHIARQDEFSMFSSSELMVVADIMITDYSSIVFDWLIFDKKTILFLPDYDNYIENNGFYIDPLEFPVDIATSYDQLSSAISNNTIEDINKFKKIMIGDCDGRSTDRLIDIIMSLLSEH